jgi:hypothetical protein
MEYDLERFGPTGFQDLAAALAVAVFGPGVQAMGAGKDGGRDLYFRGQLVWTGAEDQPGELWDGYTVFQVKHKARLAARQQDNASWLWSEIRGELDDWADVEKARDPVPDYLVFVTNVPLTPAPNAGGHDFIHGNIRNYLRELDDSARDVGDGSDRKAKLARLRRIREVGYPFHCHLR